MSEVFDQAEALEKTAGDMELLSEVIRFTLEDMPVILDSISSALENGELGEASRLAHKAKGSAGACGARSLYLRALDLELAGRDGESDCIETLPPLMEAFDAFRLHPMVVEIASLDPSRSASIG